MGTMTAAEIAVLVGGDLRGDAERVFEDVGPLQEAGTRQVSFVASERQIRQLADTQAGAVLLPRMLMSRASAGSTVLIGVEDPQEAFVAVMLRFRPPAARQELGISPLAYVSPTAVLGEGCNVFPGAYVGDGVVMGRRCDVHPGAVIGPGCRLGDEVTIHANAVLYHDVQLGSRVIVHATAVIGADGFGYRFVQGRFIAIPHTGTVRLEDDVEIGAGTTVDRGMIGDTVIGAGTKLDNQVMIGHNCRIGKHNAFASQVGLAGSVTTGDYVRCGGQVGIADHSHLGSGCAVGAKAGVAGTVPDGERYQGLPAGPERETVKAHLSLKKLPEMRVQLRELESLVETLRAELAALQAVRSPLREAA